MCKVSLMAPWGWTAEDPEDHEESVSMMKLFSLSFNPRPLPLLCIVMWGWETTVLLCQMVLCEILAIAFARLQKSGD